MDCERYRERSRDQCSRLDRLPLVDNSEVEKTLSRGGQGRVTIREVAEQSGVSVQTVSRVVNKRPDVADTTRANVERVIAELGYEPNVLAQGLVTQRKTSIGFVTAGLDYVGVGSTLGGIARKCEENGFGLLLKTVPPVDHEALTEAIRFFVGRGVFGVIVLLPRLDLDAYVSGGNLPPQMPSVIFLRSSGHPEFTTVTVDSHKGAMLATKHLLGVGRTEIGHIAGGSRSEWVEAQERFAGWRDSLEEAGQDVSSNRWVDGDWTAESGARAFEQLLEQYPGMDAVFTANDQMALGVLSVCHRRSIRVPEDLAVIGFDNVDESAQYMPPLSTVAQPLTTLGEVAFEQLLEEVNSDSKQPMHRVLDVELIVRKSTKPAKT